MSYSQSVRRATLVLTTMVATMAPLLAIATPHLGDAGNRLLQVCNGDEHAVVLAPAAQINAPAAAAVWLDDQRLLWPGSTADGHFVLYASAAARLVGGPGQAISGFDQRIELSPVAADVSPRFGYLPNGVVLASSADDVQRLGEALRGQLWLVREDASGRVQQLARTQIAGFLDHRFAAHAETQSLGLRYAREHSELRLWAPTAQLVHLCRYGEPDAAATDVLPLRRDDASGIWSLTLKGDVHGSYAAYLVDVHVAGVGIVRNRVTDPYSSSLSANSKRIWLGDIDAPALQPAGWLAKRPRPRLQAMTDMVIYELHVRDFSINDPSVAPELRGKYGAFALTDTHGVNHLRELAGAGITDVHLLPIFDLATVPETGCVTPSPQGAPDSTAQQTAVAAVKAQDCFNWGYDPFHYSAPEGSYASDANDGALRVVELRSMVQALHGMGLRVGMDVVYNHTSASGQDPRSVLDRIVPGYYHRLDAQGQVTRSTCCENTATEHRMMAKLMIDSVVAWARDYRIDSFRFDLMGHQPREVMLQLQQAVDAAVGHPVQLIGEGWNFGEVADGERFVQASQLSLPGSGIATFSDRARDALRGGGAGDNGVDQLRRQGYLNGLHYAPNAHVPAEDGRADLLRAADLVRVGLAGSLRDYRLQNADGAEVALSTIDYGGGQPAGYVSQPAEVVNYVENHDNQTLYDLNAFKLPVATSSAERARVQILGAAAVAFSQGIAYYHAGIELLRSKSMDRNSYDSGDWFNRIDWRGQEHYFGTGLPPAQDNQASWPYMRPLLANTALRASPADMAWTKAAFLDLLRIRASSRLFRLTEAAQIEQRLRFLNTGPDQIGTTIVGHLDGADLDEANFAELLYLINVATKSQQIAFPSESGKRYRLHPVHRRIQAGDPRIAEQARYEAEGGVFQVPARSAVVFVIEQE